MEFSFPWPTSDGEWLAWAAAAATALIGLFMLFAPRATLRMAGLQTAPAHPEALAEARATMAGFRLGVGLGAILLAQPLVYTVLGLAWGLTFFGRLVSVLSDGGATLRNFALLAVELALALLPLAFVFGFVA